MVTGVTPRQPGRSASGAMRRRRRAAAGALSRRPVPVSDPPHMHGPFRSDQRRAAGSEAGRSQWQMSRDRVSCSGEPSGQAGVGGLPAPRGRGARRRPDGAADDGGLGASTQDSAEHGAGHRPADDLGCARCCSPPAPAPGRRATQRRPRRADSRRSRRWSARGRRSGSARSGSPRSTEATSSTTAEPAGITAPLLPVVAPLTVAVNLSPASAVAAQTRPLEVSASASAGPDHAAARGGPRGGGRGGRRIGRVGAGEQGVVPWCAGWPAAWGAERVATHGPWPCRWPVRWARRSPARARPAGRR